jgi:alpha-amylase
MTREGLVGGATVKMTKGVTLEAGGSALDISYLIEGLPQDHATHFSVEFNLAGLPSGADYRFFNQQRQDQRLGDLGTLLELENVNELGLVDEWQGIDLKWTANQPTNVWTYPVETVSQSESGIELVHQSVTVQPHWFVKGDANGRWTVSMRLTANTSVAESRASGRKECEGVKV